MSDAAQHTDIIDLTSEPDNINDVNDDSVFVVSETSFRHGTSPQGTRYLETPLNLTPQTPVRLGSLSPSDTRYPGTALNISPETPLRLGSPPPPVTRYQNTVFRATPETPVRLDALSPPDTRHPGTSLNLTSETPTRPGTSPLDTRYHQHTTFQATPTTLDTLPPQVSRYHNTALNLTPGTPDLPSPSMLLGAGTSVRPNTGLSRTDALQIPSSPLAFLANRSVSPEGFTRMWNNSSSEDEPQENNNGISSPVGDLTAEFNLDMRSSMLVRANMALACSSEASTEILSSDDDSNGVVVRSWSLNDRVFNSSVIRRDPWLDSEPCSDDRSVSRKEPHCEPRSDGPTPFVTRVSRAERQMERQRMRQRKQQEREANLLRKQQERQDQRLLSSVNKKRIDPQQLLQDTTLVVDPELFGSLGITPSIFEYLQAENITWRMEKQPIRAVRWEMRLRRKWDAELKMYVPRQPCVVEKMRVAMVVLDGKGFMDMLVQKRVERRVEIWRASLAVRRLIVVVVGLQKNIRRAGAEDTREFARLMRVAIRDGQVEAQANRPEPQQQAVVSEEAIDDALLRLHLSHPWAIWFTQCADARALAKLVAQMTADLASAQYYNKDDDDSIVGYAASDMESSDEPSSSSTGNNIGLVTSEVCAALRTVVVKSGANFNDAWVCALTQIPKVTRPVADTIVARYPTPRALFDAWAQLVLVEQRELMLAALPVVSCVSSTSGRRLGPVMSARIYHLFNESDPTRPFNEL
ncbi:crossover junction endonuclease eme1 [Coemansia sp. RSA 1722]|nr:crossover junction endonuclease eme1 [Coemansia sp. RSA 1722]